MIFLNGYKICVVDALKRTLKQKRGKCDNILTIGKKHCFTSRTELYCVSWEEKNAVVSEKTGK